MIGLKEVEHRLMRACKTLRALPDREAQFQIVRSHWPQAPDDEDMAYGYNEARRPKFVPRPFDVSDFLVALAWVQGMPRREFRLIWWRSFDMDFRQIGNRVHRSDETARRWYRDAMYKAWGVANKITTTPIDKSWPAWRYGAESSENGQFASQRRHTVA